MIERLRDYDLPHKATRMPFPKLSLACAVAGLLLFPTLGRTDDWTTVGFDAQRSSWIRADRKTSPATVRGPDFRFLWNMDLPNEARSGNALSAPVLLDFLISHRGFRSLAFVGGSSGGIYVIDTDLARMEWERHFLPGSSKTSADCPGGMTANLTRPTAAAMPSMLGFGGRGRRSPAKSGVGEPGAGAVTLAEVANRTFRPQQQPQSTRRTRPPARRALRGVTLVYALSANGALHTLYVSNGRDHKAPMPFLPADANARGLIVVDGIAYVSTSNECGGAPDGVWALDLESGAIKSWKSESGAVAGVAGMSFGPEGTVYAATENGSLVALAPKSLEQEAASEAVGFLSSPVVIDFQGNDHVAALARDGSLRVYGSGDLARPAASTASSAEGAGSETALAAWRDGGGTHWILVPSKQSVTAWKLTGGDSGMALEKGWQSPTMANPLPPIIVNGVVFALDGGGSSQSATLFALEGTTGEQLWDSGNVIEAKATGHALSSGPGHVFLTTSDSAVYTFGFPMEH